MSSWADFVKDNKFNAVNDYSEEAWLIKSGRDINEMKAIRLFFLKEFFVSRVKECENKIKEVTIKIKEQVENGDFVNTINLVKLDELHGELKVWKELVEGLL